MASHLSEAETTLRSRLRDLNTKAYYLLVALGFIYGTSSGSGWLKWALALTALAAVLPVQDFANSMTWLGRVRNFKIVCLCAALFCTLLWIAIAKPARTSTDGRFQMSAQDSMLALDTKTGQLCRTTGSPAVRPVPPLCSELK